MLLRKTVKKKGWGGNRIFSVFWKINNCCSMQFLSCWYFSKFRYATDLNIEGLQGATTSNYSYLNISLNKLNWLDEKKNKSLKLLANTTTNSVFIFNSNSILNGVKFSSSLSEIRIRAFEINRIKHGIVTFSIWISKQTNMPLVALSLPFRVKRMRKYIRFEHFLWSMRLASA